MMLKGKSWTNPFRCTGSILVFPSPCSILLIVVFLTTSVRSQVQNTSTQPPSSGSINSQLCCPINQFWVPDGCSPLSNGTEFNPNITAKPNNMDILWEYHTLECPSGYEAKNYTLNGDPNMLYFKDGVYLVWKKHILFHFTKNFCASLLPSGKYIGVTCRPKPEKKCTEATCVQKCCDDGEIVSFGRSPRCIPSTTSNFSFEIQSTSGIRTSQPTDLQILYQEPECKHSKTLNPENKIKDRFYLLKNGFLYHLAEEKTYKESQFCLDHFIINGTEGTEPTAIVCTGPGLSTKPTLKIKFYAAGVMISAIFLMVTIIFHIFIPKLRDMQGQCLLCHMISLQVAEITLFIGYIYSNEIPKTYCVINGYVQQFALSATFFWLNVMCYDIWRVIRGTMKVIPLADIQENDNIKFRIYSAYAWGGPSLLVLVTVILHNVPNHPDQTFLKPDIGLVSCWFFEDLQRLAYFYSVSAVLFTGNIILLGHTILTLHRLGVAFQCCKKAATISASNRGHHEAFWNRFSLFTLMALCWITEILSFKIPPENLWIPTDIINTLQGFFVFVIFLLSKHKRNLVKATLKPILLRVSNATRKVSQSDDSGGVLYTSNTTTTYVTNQSHSNDAVITEVAQNEQRVNPSADKDEH